ncbi:hypothetical protein ACWDZ4_13575 [Streptomyces sp. NPDC003016]
MSAADQEEWPGLNHAAEWTAAKLRWDLAVGPQEQAEPLHLADERPATEAEFETALEQAVTQG